jgi:cation-transporting P-type ATPase 13A2
MTAILQFMRERPCSILGTFGLFLCEIYFRNTSEEKSLGLVIRTGFTTTKGRLVRNILHPEETISVFTKDSYKYLLILIIISVLSIIVLIVVGLHYEITTLVLIFNSLDLFTSGVPPELPLVLSTCTSYSLLKLKKQKIFCISPIRINFAARINKFCFDKTGTLTESDLSLIGVIPTEQMKDFPQMKFSTLEKDASKLNSVFAQNEEMENKLRLLKGMSCCHLIANIKDQLFGDVLDIEMFKGTKSSLSSHDKVN